MHIMLDLETLGTHPVKAPIIQIAAVPFEPLLDGAMDVGFQAFATVDSNVEAPFNRPISPETLRWWLRTDAELLNTILTRDDADHLSTCLHELSRYLGHYEIDGVWANGPTFDVSMLELAYEQAGIAVPWDFRKVRCCRTIFALAGDDETIWEGGTRSAREILGARHNALVDCDRQIRVIQQTYRRKIVL